MRRDQTQDIAVPAIDVSKFGVAEADGVLQPGLEYRFQIPGRRADTAQHSRRSRLLLQRLGKLTRALLLRLEEPHVFDRNHSLVSESLHQLDLLLGERPYGSALQEKHADCNPFSKKWYA